MGREVERPVLEDRLRVVEDHLAILNLVAAYGPSVDGGAVEEAGRLWAEDCWYDSDASSAGASGVHGRTGIEGVAKMTGDSDRGIAHVTHFPVVTVDGDRATVLGHSNVFVADGDAYGLVRVAANRWDLERIEGTWQVRRRVNRAADGSAGSKEVFAEGLREAQAETAVRGATTGAAGDLLGRVTRAEDQLAVRETIAAYGLTIDGGMPMHCGQLWTEDCAYDSDAVGANGGYHTRDGIEVLSGRDRERTATSMGYGHVTHPPLVVVDGDRATAVAPSNLSFSTNDLSGLPPEMQGRLQDGGGDPFQVYRVSANRWDLVRVGGRWQIQTRFSRTLDGGPAGKEIFAAGARLLDAERASAAIATNAPAPTVGADSADELASIERRIARLEDELALLNLFASYGPSVDGGAVVEAGRLWTEDCLYDSDTTPEGVHGRSSMEAVAARIGEGAMGVAHISHAPITRVDGDRATIVNHSNVYIDAGDGPKIVRLAANRWDVVRVDGAWQVERKLNRLLDGSLESKDVFADGVRAVLGE